MKMHWTLATGLVIALTLAAPAWAQGGGGRAGRAGRGAAAAGGGAAAAIRGLMGGMTLNPYQDIVDHVDVTADQKTKLQPIGDAQEKELTALMTDLQQKRQAMNANPNPDPAARQELMQATQDAADQREKIVAKYDAQIAEILTPEQKAQWEAFKFTQLVETRLAPVQLTEDQKAQIETLSKDAGKAIAEAADDAAKNTARGKAFRKVMSDVLNDDQAALLLEPPAPAAAARAGGARAGRGGRAGRAGRGGAAAGAGALGA